MNRITRFIIYFAVVALIFFAARIHDRSISLSEQQLKCLSAKYYGSRELPYVKINSEEKAIYKKINSLRANKGLHPLRISNIAVLVAKYHSNLMRKWDTGKFDFKGEGSIEQRRIKAGIGDSCFYALYGNISISRILRQIESKDAATYDNDELTHIGVGVVHQWFPWQYWATIIYIERIASVEKFPIYLPRSGLAETLRWSIDKSYSSSTVEITTSSGKSLRLPVHRFLGRFYRAEIPFEREGKYVVEILADGPYGPEVAQIMPVYVGRRRESVSADSKSEQLKTHKSESMERELFVLINKTRRKYEIKPLRLNGRLCAIARIHSHNMARAGKAVHNLPGFPDLVQRIKSANLNVLMEGENVAFDSSVARAHKGLMGSPGHRYIIIDPDFTDVGISIVRKGRLLFITEDFAKFVPSVSPVEGRREILKRIRESTNIYLKENAKLSSIAQEHSRKMASYEKFLDARGLQREIDACHIKHKQIYFLTMKALTVKQASRKIKEKVDGLNFITEIGIGVQQDKQSVLWITLVLI